MARRKVAKAVYIEADQDDALKQLSLTTHVPVAEYIREAVSLVLRRHGIVTVSS